MGVKTRTFSGVTTNEILPREIKHQELSRRAAGEGVVLLKNENSLPISADEKIAIYGNGIQKIMKGGSGSGDVNERRVVSFLEGLKAAGFTVINEGDVQDNMDAFVKARLEWRDRIHEKLANFSAGDTMNFLKVMAETKVAPVDIIDVKEADVLAADAAVYLISRQAGEGKDRPLAEGEWYLTAKEKDQLDYLAKNCKNLIVLVNAGGQVDIASLQENENVNSIVYVSQPGMEAGHVIADILTGKVCPSGRLATTWAKRYEDFPNAQTFSYVNGDTTNEKYEEGIYVGYRYFDSFGVEPLYPFGYGLSYTSFDRKAGDVTVDGNTVSVKVTVTNTGDVAGKHVVPLFASCPQGADGKELKKLVGFKKTNLLAPGQEQTLTISFDAKTVAAFLQERSAWVVEAGSYILLMGAPCGCVTPVGVLEVAEDIVLEEVKHISPLQTELNEIRPDGKVIEEARGQWLAAAKENGLPALAYAPKAEVKERLPESPYHEKAKEIAAQMSYEELTAILMGEITKGQDHVVENQLVETGMFVPGAAGETSCRFTEKYGVPAISMADGPAGLRVITHYDADNATGKIYGQGTVSAIQGGFLAKEYHRENATTYYMYTTAFPVGTLLAQTWNLDLVEEVGQAVGKEMEEYKIAWWLAPGMNIHRNPLCGRNFEHYSEEPVVAGKMGASMTKGVQSIPGVGTTVKHFACNNQEDNRFFSNSILSERALREIYLRGFEITVKESQPMCIMSSYNLINGVSAANNADTLTVALREEWDFKGIVMTDWTTTINGSATAYKCAIAGNDLIMPAGKTDVANVMAALESGDLPREKAEECAVRMIEVLFATLGMEDPKPYQWVK